jgi:branched-chain amino acid transport system ATP-binding protein
MKLHGAGHPGDRPRRHVSGNRDPSGSSANAAGSLASVTHRAAIRERLDALAGDEPLLRIDGLVAGYGNVEVVHGVDLRLGRGQALCLIGPIGAGKSTILHSIFGLADLRGGRIEVAGRNVTRLGPNAKLRDAGIAYVLRDSSVFPDMTVEQNLWLGGYLMKRRSDARQAAERIFERYPFLALRRNEPARVLSGGERRLLEISRALVMQPRLLLVDEPTIGLEVDARRATERVFERYPFLAACRDEPARLLGGGERRLLEIARAIVMRPRLLLVDEPSLDLEPAFIDQIFGMLRDLRDRDGLAIVLVERNASAGLELADIGCVVVSGEIAMVGSGAELLRDPTVGRLFLGE